jgi:hypothetical protein
MVTPALVVRRCWSEIFEVCELQAFQPVSISALLGNGSRSLAMRWIRPRFVNHGAWSCVWESGCPSTC